MSVEDVIRRHEEIQRAGDELLAEKRSEALAVAWTRRSQLKELRKAFKAKEVDALDLLAGGGDPRVEAVVKEVKLKSYLPMIPGIGQSRAHDIIGAFGVSGNRTIGSLNERQRSDLVRIIKGARDPHYAF